MYLYFVESSVSIVIKATFTATSALVLYYRFTSTIIYV